MNPEIDPQIIRRVQVVRQWYAQWPGRVDFDSTGYQAAIKANPCIICAVVQNDPDLYPHPIVAETDEFIAFLDRFPVYHGHTLVCPKAHLENVFDDLSLPQYLRLQEFIYRVGQAVAQVTSPERIYVCSFGSAQVVSHLHFHLIPLPAGVPLDGQQAVAMIRAVTGVQGLSKSEQKKLASEIRIAME